MKNYTIETWNDCAPGAECWGCFKIVPKVHIHVRFIDDHYAACSEGCAIQIVQNRPIHG